MYLLQLGWYADFPDEDFDREYQALLAAGIEHPRPNALDVHRSQIEWGASGGGQEIVAYIFNQVADDTAQLVIGAAIGALFQRLKTWRDERGATPDIERPMDRQEAVERAKLRVETGYKVRRGPLEVRSEERAGDQWTVVLEDADNRFTVTLGLVQSGGQSSHSSLTGGTRKSSCVPRALRASAVVLLATSL